MDIPVTVNTVWTGPDGFLTTNTAQRVMRRTTTYTSTAMVSSFGREQSGVYTCTATVNSASSLVSSSMGSVSVRVTVGKPKSSLYIVLCSYVMLHFVRNTVKVIVRILHVKQFLSITHKYHIIMHTCRCLSLPERSGVC